MEAKKTAERMTEDHMTPSTSKESKGKEKLKVSLPKAWNLLKKDYKMRSLIGSGTFGQVVKAKHIRTGKTVAIKLIENLFESTYEGVKIIREVQIMRHLTQMNNQYSIKLYDVIPNEEMSCIFLVMEYVQSDLKKVLSSSENVMLDQQHILVIVYKLLCALKFLHSANIMHRDLKPANILIDENINVKICDFGLSRSQDIGKVYEKKSLDVSSRKILASNLTETRKNRRHQERQLSNHAVSRWYRPPEIILLEKQYDEKVDMWSAGCILSELVYCQSDYINLGADSQNRHLFKGDSCYPLSPKYKEIAKVGEKDQLRVIFDILGKQSEEDLSFISDKEALPFAMRLNSLHPKIEFEKEFPNTNLKVLQVLEEMLEFNPFFRKSATQLLENPIFDVCRQEYQDSEMIAPYQIELETDLPGAIDYKEFNSSKFDIPKLKEILIKEIKLVQSMELLS